MSSYLNDIGGTAYGVNIPVENGYINLSNGNLHLEFPLSHHPQRGSLSLEEKLTYDSRIWNFSPFGSNGSYHWWPYNVSGAQTFSGGWQFITGGEVGLAYGIVTNQQVTNCDGPDDGGGGDDPEPTPGQPSPQTRSYRHTYTIDEYLEWRDPSGNIHPFSATNHSYRNQCDSTQNSSVTTGGGATDGSGFTIPSDPNGAIRVIDSGNTQVYPNIADRYGNFWSFDGTQLTDDTGQIPVLVTTNGLTTYYDVLSPNGPINNLGTRVRYTVTSAPVNVSTQFMDYGTSDIHSWVSSNLLTPVQSISLPDGTQYTFTYDINGELQTMTLPTGGVITYGYTDFVDSSNTENNWIASHQVGTNPAETFQPIVGTTCSNYSSGCVEYTTHHRPSGNDVVHELTLANGAWNTGTFVYNGTVSVRNRPAPPQGPSNLLSLTTTTNQYSNPCSGTTCIGTNTLTSSSTVTSFTNNGSPGIYSQATSTFDPQTGRPLSVKEWDFTTDSSSQAFSRAADRDTEYTYTGSDVQTVKVSDVNGTQVGLTTYGYTASAATAPTVAGWSQTNAGGPYLQSVSHWINTNNTYSTTTYTMDTTGMIASVQDPSSNLTSFSYQCNNSLPYQVTNPLKQTSQSSYDCNSGTILTSQDPNDLSASRIGTKNVYDSIGRISSITQADGGSVSYTYPSSTSVQTDVAAAPDPDVITLNQTDEFGRPSKSIIQGVTSETTYDVAGRVHCVSNPWANTEASTCISSYDGLDRPLTQVLQDGSSTRTISYAANTITSTDERGVSSTRTVNAFGKLTNVSEPTPFGQANTSYLYDGLGNISQVVQSGVASNGDVSRNRTFTYDSLSRLVCSSVPERYKGANLQTQCSDAYVYDLNGNLTQKTDASGIVITYSYDALNRLHYKTYKGGSGTGPVGFGYDGQDEAGGPLSEPHDNTIGRLSHVSNLVDTAATFAYDAVGRMTLKTECMPNCPAVTVTKAKYNLAGNLSELDFPGPGNHKMTQQYDAFGRLSTVGDGNSPQTYVQAITHDPDGLLDTLTLGNGVTQKVGRNARLQVQSIDVSSSFAPFSGQPLLSHTYCYSNCASGGLANNGSIWNIADNLNSQRTQGFTYDSLNRISSFSVNGQLNQQYKTDSFGNMSGMANGNPILTFGADNRINNLPCAASVSPAYDADGNQLCDLDKNGLPIQFVYDAENRLTQLRTANAPNQPPVWTYTYSADGDRVYKKSADGQMERQYVYFGGKVIAEHDQTGDQSDQSKKWNYSVYAGNSLIARVNPTFNALHTTGNRDPNVVNMACGTNYDVYDPSGTHHTVQHGDRILWNQKSISSHGGISFALQGGGYVGATDDAGQIVYQDDSPTGQWKLRSATLDDSYMNRVLDHLVVTTQNTTPSGPWAQWISDVVIVGVDGTVTPFLTTDAGSGSAWTYCGVASPTFAFEATTPDTSVPSSATALMAITYSLGDHLGTAQIEFNSFGIPTWRGDFAPFGAPLTSEPTTNRYQYTGLERDSELQQDHTQFRQLSYLNGRWTTPDPYNGSMDFSNPQSLNRYGYVGNMPLSFTDPSGLFPLPCGFSTGGGAAGSSFTWGGIGTGSISTGGVVLAGAEAAGCLYAAYKLIFSHPSFHQSTTPRPGGKIWSEHYKGGFKVQPFSVAGTLLGIDQNGCEFGACGIGPSAFGPGGPGGGSNPLQVTSGAVSGGFVLPLFFGVLGPAGSFSYDPKNHLACFGGGIGLSVGHTVNGGPVVVHAKPGNTSEDVLSGWSISGGYNWTPWFGYQGSKGSSGYTAGYSFGVPGASGAVTYSRCKHTGG